jgi:hypothetical protein
MLRFLQRTPAAVGVLFGAGYALALRRFVFDPDSIAIGFMYAMSIAFLALGPFAVGFLMSCPCPLHPGSSASSFPGSPLS